MGAELIMCAMAFVSGFVLGVVGISLLVMGGQCSRDEERQDGAQP